MIQHTFCILPGIGEHLEKRLWRAGILTWKDFLAADSISFIRADKKDYYNLLLSEAQQNLESVNVSYFVQHLKHSEHWRLFQELRGSAVALDIETDGGIARNGGCVTVAGLYDGFDYTALVQGKNLSREKLNAELSRYRYIITFYGAAFDLPYLRAVYGLSLDLPHFDLCFSGRRAGLRGGLKKIEKNLGMQREAAVADFDGFDAVRLWQQAQRGCDTSLELLITYNRYDTINLFELADIIYQKLRAKTGIESFYL
jgi:uncharacterized protein YprB with RNaseH-like and TPR domain